MVFRDEAAFCRALEEQAEQTEEAAVRLRFQRHVPAPFSYVRFDGLLRRQVRLLVFSARLLRAILFGTDVVEEVRLVARPEALDEVVERPDLRCLPRGKSADTGVGRVFPELFRLGGEAPHAEKDHEQAGDEEGGRRVRLRAELRVRRGEHPVDDGKLDRQDDASELAELFVGVDVREFGLQGGFVSRTAERFGLHGSTSFEVAVEKTLSTSKRRVAPKFWRVCQAFSWKFTQL